jgi:hypothetical protein
MQRTLTNDNKHTPEHKLFTTLVDVMLFQCMSVL